MMRSTKSYLTILSLGLCALCEASFGWRQDSTQLLPPAARQAELDSTVVVKPSAPQNGAASQDDALTTKDLINSGIALLSVLIALVTALLYRRLARKKKEAELRAEHEFKQRIALEENARKAEERRAQLRVEHEFARQQEQHAHVQKAKTAEARYRHALETEVCQIHLAAPGVDEVPVGLVDTFVRLNLSEHYRSEEFSQLGELGRMRGEHEDLSPEEVLTRAFRDYGRKLLLIIGDPGSGKTTLMKYYAMLCCQDEGYLALGFEQPVLPFYLPLREVDPAQSLAENLAHWASERELAITAEDFHTWLQNRDTLVLLDGLDEKSKLEERKKICEWIDGKCVGLKRSRFILTSRSTGMRSRDNLTLRTPHVHAEVRDFSTEQKHEFLRKWFRAAFLESSRPLKHESEAEWRERQLREAEKNAQDVIDYLEHKENRSLRELAGIPMLLQLLALIWKKHKTRPESRTKLYDIALDYLLEYRDEQRHLAPVLKAEKARRVLAPVSLWMQEELAADEVAKERMHDYLKPILEPLDSAVQPEALCANFRDRAGLIADYGRNDYIFRHKSFREYFAGMQLVHVYEEKQRVQRLVETFGETWWAEALRYFFSKANGKAFTAFMAAFFASDKSRELTSEQQDLLLALVREAPERPLDALLACLHDQNKTANQQRYALDCLKAIGGERVREALHAFAEERRGLDSIRDIAREIMAQLEAPMLKPTIPITAPALFEQLPPSFRNPVEYNAEYILLRGGTIKFSVTKKVEKVPDLYFAKYPVTNKQYRRFIRYLQEEEPELNNRLAPPAFAEKLLEFASADKAYLYYLSRDRKAWPEKLKSKRDNDRRFNGEDQPVAGVTWYAARAYCFWLTALQRETSNQQQVLYRLPHEIEWERAAAGRLEEGSPRKYPWPNEKGEPNEKLANYGHKVGQTTPVGRYTEGATPEGLMDMAGNVWEWQENWSSERKEARALRGGSWSNTSGNLRGVARGLNAPVNWNFNFGFRVACASSPII
ncbi:SUMF1/EgtB/PvdO family nonheme iron enzyme [candidate division KSB1 bacterium]|nr:SUMF1/EgtB/PvdO family nonheme iron enzyme [candidate division KSB1 bacterium]